MRSVSDLQECLEAQPFVNSFYYDETLGQEDHQNDNPSAHDHGHSTEERIIAKLIPLNKSENRPDQDVACKIMVKLVKLTLPYHGNDGPSLKSEESSVRVCGIGIILSAELKERYDA